MFVLKCKECDCLDFEHSTATMGSYRCIHCDTDIEEQEIKDNLVEMDLGDFIEIINNINGKE